MRILVDRPTDEILQVEKVPLVGETAAINGKYVLPTPEGVTVYVTPDSVVLPVSDPNSVVGQAYAGLLAQFPQYENILFNPLLEDTDLDDLDFAATFTDPNTFDVFSPRASTGRGTGGPLTSGQAPTNTSLLPANDAVTPTRPGLIITDEIDVGALTMNVGADEFVVYWYLYDCSTTEDVRSSFGALAGQNLPALRNVIETDQEPLDFQAYISTNGGASWVEVQRLVPVSFCDKAKTIRLAFRNNNTDQRKYTAAYAVMF